MRGLVVLALLTLASCGGVPPGGTASLARAVASGGGTCPAPDPVRDGPLVDAIQTRDAGPVRAALSRDAADARARAALAVLEGQRPDPDEAACFAPYLT